MARTLWFETTVVLDAVAYAHTWVLPPEVYLDAANAKCYRCRQTAQIR